MARIRHISRWNSRQTSIQLVWIMDNPIQSLRRCHTLFPPFYHIRSFILQHALRLRPVISTNSNHSTTTLKPTTTHPPLVKALRLHPTRHLRQPIRLLRRRHAALRPTPRLAPPIHQVRLGIPGGRRRRAGRPQAHPRPRVALGQRDVHRSPADGLV